MTFGDGPLGLVLTDTRLIREVHESGQARALGVQAGDSLVKVGDADVSATDYQDILTLIKASTRPVTLVFIRKPAHSAARNAVTAAGGFLKKALVTGVSLIAAVDRAIGAAVDDGARVRRLCCVDLALHHYVRLAPFAASGGCGTGNRQARRAAAARRG